MTEDLKQRVEEVLINAFQAQIKKDFPNAPVIPSRRHHEQKAEEISGFLGELIKEITEREAKLVDALKAADKQFGNWVCSCPEDGKAQNLIKTTLGDLGIEEKA